MEPRGGNKGQFKLGDGMANLAAKPDRAFAAAAGAGEIADAGINIASKEKADRLDEEFQRY